MSQLIEDLERTLETLRDTDVEFRYTNWSKCACGHLYNATVGEPLSTWYPVIQPSDYRYQRALEAVLTANHIRIPEYQTMAIALSMAISELIPEGDDRLGDNVDVEARAVAIQYVEAAIRAEQAPVDAHDQVLVA